MENTEEQWGNRGPQHPGGLPLLGGSRAPPGGGGHSESAAANHPTGRRPQAPCPSPSRAAGHRFPRAAARAQEGPSRLALRWGPRPIRSAVSWSLAPRHDETRLLIGRRCLPPLPEQPEPSLCLPVRPAFRRRPAGPRSPPHDPALRAGRPGRTWTSSLRSSSMSTAMG